MAKNINYSFIVPHKNIPDLLTRCVDSIPRRDDVQIIVVDDNSDADKVDFDHFPFLDDPGVEVVLDKSGKGAGHARNLGLEKAKGKWLVFADADDYFLYSIKGILDKYVNSAYDIIYFLSQNVDVETYMPASTPRGYNAYVNNYNENDPETETTIRFCYNAPWGKIYRKSLIDEHKIQFDEFFKANDMRFGYLSGYYAKTISVDKRAMYCLTNRAGSLSTIYDPKACLLIASVKATSLEFLKEKKLTNTFAYRSIYNGMLDLALRIRKSDKEMFKELVLQFKKIGVSLKRLSVDISVYKLKTLYSKIRTLAL